MKAEHEERRQPEKPFEEQVEGLAARIDQEFKEGKSLGEIRKRREDTTKLVNAAYERFRAINRS